MIAPFPESTWTAKWPGVWRWYDADSGFNLGFSGYELKLLTNGWRISINPSEDDSFQFRRSIYGATSKTITNRCILPKFIFTNADYDARVRECR